MAKRVFLQGVARVAVAAIVILGVAGVVAPRAGEPAPPGTPRQEEILRELASFRPQGDETPGVWMLSVWDGGGLENLVDVPGGSANAAAHFKRLEDLYPAEREALEGDGSGTRGVDELLLAAEAGTCRLIPDFYPVFDSVDAKQPDFMVLRLYLQALLKRAEKAERAGDAAGAERCHRAALLCGRHLAADRPSALVYMTGLIFKLRGGQEYAKFLRRHPRTGKAEAADRFVEEVTALLRLFHWKANTALSEMDGFACLPAAVRVALEDAEPCWRKEAVTRLAVLRHGVPSADRTRLDRNPGFERMAMEALETVSAKDPDPTVRRLAVWAVLNVAPADGVEHLFR